MERKGGLSISLELIDLEKGEASPQIAAYALDRSGKVLRKLATASDGKISLDPALAKEKHLRIGFGPDVEDLKDVRRKSLALFRVSDAFPRWEKNPVVSLAPEIYRDWFPFRVCVSGRVRRCWPFYFRLPWPIGDFPHVPFPPLRFHCTPICDGVVEIYERTCCCHRISIIDLSDLLRRLREIVRIPIPIPEPDPGPLGPIGPEPGPDPAPFTGLGDIVGFNPQPDPPRFRGLLDHGAIAGFDPQPEPPFRASDAGLQKRALSQGMTLLSGKMRDQITADIATLESFSRQSLEEVQRFIDLRPYLWHWICHCTSRKLGETTLEADGGFTFCWRPFPIFIRRNCSKRYYYKVRQRINGVWVYVYDGSARHEYFERADFASLETYRGRGCNTPDDDYDHDKPFVLLEGIGSTPSSELISHWGGMTAGGADLTQISDDAVSAPPTNGGLVYPPEPGDSDANVLKNCPWGGDLYLRLHFSPDMENAPVNAEFYRVTFREADNNGQPIAAAPLLEFSEQLSWNRYAMVNGQTEIQPEILGPFPTNIGEPQPANLYKIPYANDHDWTTDVIHHAVFRTGTRNAKFLVYIEVFDSAGNRLTPAANSFDFLRRMKFTGPDSLATVGFNKLANYFWIDNKHCVGDIIDFRKNGVPSTDECQFKTGKANDKISVGYRAYHETVNSALSNPHTFMWTHGLTWTRGLNGPQGTFAPAGNQPGLNQPAALSGGVAESGTRSFSELLGTDTVGAKCTFSVYLRAYAKHTNGSSRMDNYDGDEVASFALEITS